MLDLETYSGTISIHSMKAKGQEIFHTVCNVYSVCTSNMTSLSLKV